MILPLEALIKQYKSDVSPVVKQIDIGFIQHSLERVDDYQRRALIPLALSGCSGDAGFPQRQAPFSQIILRLLLDSRIPERGSKEDEAYRESVGLSDPSDARYIANLIGVFIRLQPPTSTRDWTQSNPTFESQELALFVVENPHSMKIFQRITELKSKLVAFLASAAFTDEEKFLPALYAAASADSRVASSAEDVIKRSSVSLENENIVSRLYAAHQILPASIRIQVLNMLSKSVRAAGFGEKVMNAVMINLPQSQETTDVGTALKPRSSLERNRLHNALFQFLAWVSRIGRTANMRIAVDLVAHMKNYITEQGWPKPDAPLSSDDIDLRGRAYETIGLFVRASDMTVEERMPLASWLFRSLAEDPNATVVVNIDGALSSLAASLSASAPLPLQALEHITGIIIACMHMDNEDFRSVRHAAVKWANECLPFSDKYARWVDILAIGGRMNERSDVVEGGRKGLDPWSYFGNADTPKLGDLPKWEDMVEEYFGLRILPDFTKLDEMNPHYQPMEVDSAPTEFWALRNFEGPRLGAFSVALNYCKQMMFLAALWADTKMGPDWMPALEAKVKNDVVARRAIRNFLDTPDHPVQRYLESCIQGALYPANELILEDSLRCFVDVASLCPSELLGSKLENVDRVLRLLLMGNKEVRSLVARIYGILAPHPTRPVEELESRVSTLGELFKDAEKKSGEQLNWAEGAVLAHGYLSSRGLWYRNWSPPDDSYPRYLLTVENIPTSLLQVTLESFAQLWSAGLALPPTVESSAYSVKKVVQRLLTLAKKGDEKAIFALGRLALGWSVSSKDAEESIEEGVLGSILQGLFGLHDNKRAELQLTVGEAITAAVARWHSDFVKLTLGVDVGAYPHAEASTACVTLVLDKLFADCKGTKPSLLKASGIWLFCMVQYCAHLDQVKTRLREAQAAFMRLLNVKDELVQETASRGLSLVYERGDESLQKELVKDLVSAFTGSGPQLKVDQDTELFEPGALPTGEGTSVTSYKDIVNLANEVGDQTLVYKFMSLASNAATWSTRSAFGRFGLSNILSESEVDPALYPKLYRYRFDPNTNVQKSMDDIWKALVKDSGRVIETHFDAILDDLLKSLLGREWRMREASCGALSDLLQGRPFELYKEKYTEIWTGALKVLDDVKGSVREAALRLCMALSKNIVRQLEVNNKGAEATAMVGQALPFLLSDKGIESSVKDVQIFATLTVLDLSKKGGAALRQYTPEMVAQLLGLLSTIEPEQINYHYQKVGEDSRDKIDKLRSQMVTRSPIMEAIENVLRHVTSDDMGNLATKLEGTIKSAIGMPTKIGCSRVLTTLSTNHASDFKPHSASFLRLMQKQAMDKNDEVSQAYARAAAYLVRVVPDSAREKYCQRLLKLYIESEEESRRQKVADAMVAWAKVSPDFFTAHETDLLPFSYFGCHDTDEYTSKIFKEVWNQHAGSSRTVQRYVPEIVQLVNKCLDTTQWSLRHTAAFTVGAMVTDVASASEATGHISEANLNRIWPVLDQTLALKTFPGKEKLLEAFPKFVEKGESLWKGDNKIAAQMRKIAVREAKRNNDDYRVHAFTCLWKFAKARNDLDMLQEIADIVSPHLDEFADENKMEVDSDKKEDVTAHTARNGFEAIARGYNRDKLLKEPREMLGKVLELVELYLPSARFGSIKREVWYDTVCDMLSLLADSKSTPSSTGKGELSVRYVASLDLEQAEAGLESQRLKRVKAVSAILDARKAGVFGENNGDDDLKDVKEQLMKAAEAERALKVQMEWKECKKRF